MSVITTGQPIAVIGMGCRLPGGVVDPASFWELLKDGTDAVIEVPAERWSAERFYDPDPSKVGRTAVCRGGFLQQPMDEFDWEFFGISPREGAQLDPQQRMLMEVTWEALEDAGLPPHLQRGSHTGVYVGGFLLDNLVSVLSPLNRTNIETHTGTSSSMAMLSNRLSYTFDFQGPSVSVDTACSASLTCLHLACQGLQTGDCDLAIAGGVNVMFRPESFITMSKGGFLAPDGRCKTFDIEANGYCRGEGVGILVLKRLSEAQADGDRIHGVLLATGANQDGKTAGITLPNPDSQIRLMQRVLKRAGVEPAEVDYVEAHGTGTQAGDQAEVHSLNTVLAQGREPDSKVWVGAVKSNIGHLEAAAGVVSIIKTLLVLKHGAVPPNLHLNTPNPALGLDQTVLRLPQQLEPLEPTEHPRYACVNAFGYGGSNATAVLQSAPPTAPLEKRPPERWLLPLSAGTKSSLQAQAAALAEFLNQSSSLDLGDLCYTLANRRSHLEHRLLACGANARELSEGLQAAAHEQGSEHLLAQGHGSEAQPCLFLYTGMGSQWFGMSQELASHEAIFEASMKECESLWEQISGTPLRNPNSSGEPMQDPIDAQPANLALQVGLTRLLRSYGIVPEAVVGHSVGEVAAAWAAGVLSLKEAFRLCYHRCRLQQQAVGLGTMLAVGLSESAVRPRLSSWNVELAAVNSPSSVVLAGAQADLQSVAQELARDGTFSRFLKVSVAYHSQQMDRFEKPFKEALRDLKVAAPGVPLYSTVTGTRITTDCQDVNYWWRNARDPVLLESAAQAAADDGFATLLEVGPHPVLGAALRDCMNSTTYCLRRGEPEQLTFQGGVGEMYCQGAQLSWKTVYPQGRPLSLPPHCWSRERLWSETEAAVADRVNGAGHPLLGDHSGVVPPRWEGDLNGHWLPYLKDHTVAGQTIFPGAGYVEMALLVAREVSGTNDTVVVENLKFLRPLNPDSTPIVQLCYEPETFALSVHSRPAEQAGAWTENTTGRLSLGPYLPPLDVDPEQLLKSNLREIATDEFYSQLEARGLCYGPYFQGVDRLYVGAGEVYAELSLKQSTCSEPYSVHPCLLDAAFHALFAGLGGLSETDQLYIPTEIKQVRLHQSVPDSVLMTGRIRALNGTKLEAEVCLLDRTGRVLLKALGLQFQALPGNQQSDSKVPDYAYSGRWVAQERDGEHGGTPRTWLRLGEPSPLDDLLGSTTRELQGDYEAILFTPSSDDLGIDGCQLLRQSLPHFGSRELCLTILTEGAHQVSGLDQDLRPSHGAIWGFARVVAREYPKLRVRLIDASAESENLTPLLEELASAQPDSEIAFRGGCRYAHRIGEHQKPSPVPSRKGQAYRLHTDKPGTFDELEFQESERRVPGPKEIEISVETSAVNFKDVMKVLNLLPASYLDETFFKDDLGMECAGVVVAAGPEVEEFKVGDQVAAVAKAGLASFTTVPAYCAVPKPLSSELSVQHVNFLAAYQGLVNLARLSEGETVLIHGGAGGVGLAAIQLAKRAKARIIATAGTPEKREYLKSLGVDFVSDSRSLKFYDDVLAYTQGEGVQVVLNSLQGEFLRKSLQLLTPDGRFIEIGKRDIAEDQKLGMAIFSRNQQFAAVDVDVMISDNPRQFNALINTVQKMLASGELQPIPSKCYPAAETIEALRYVARSRQVGKVVVEIAGHTVALRPAPREISLDADATYLVTGGFGGFGLEVCRWLYEQGAKNLAIFSRSGAKTEAAQKFVNDFEAAGGRIFAPKVDMANPQAIARGLSQIPPEAPLRGLVHCAALLRDGPISEMDAAALEEVMKAKAGGAWTLHQETLDQPLDFFVMFSSVTALLGNMGQANYAAANAFLDSLAHHRRARGLAALSLNWGALGQVGMVARDTRVQDHLESMGLKSIPVAQALNSLEWAWRENCSQVALMDVDWNRWAQRHPDSQGSPLSLLVGSAEQSGKGELRTRLLSAEGELRESIVLEFLTSLICNILRLPEDRLTRQTSMARIGVDSLMAVELTNSVSLEVGVELPALLFHTTTLGELAQEICSQLASGEDELLSQLDDMTEEQLDKLLSEIG